MINNFLELKERLNDEFSLSIVRFGNVEMQALLQKDDSVYYQMYSNAGFYVKEKKKEKEIFKKWKNLYVAGIYNCDLMLDVVSCHSFQILGDLLNRLNTWRPTLPYIEDPKWHIENIIMEYKGTIGIVSYFKKDIENQLSKMDKIWGKEIKNKFIVVKSENTITGNEPDDHWLQTFNKLKKRVKKEKEPGLWLLSCGCYGVPLCEEIKNDGKKAIYLGGLLQLLFGLKGKRWDNRTEVKRNYNQHWVYPSEKPKNAENVENACYWGDDEIIKKN